MDMRTSVERDRKSDGQKGQRDRKQINTFNF
jgi:hypothetical protein